MFPKCSRQQIFLVLMIFSVEVQVVRLQESLPIVKVRNSSHNMTYKTRIPHRLTYGDTVSILGSFLDTTRQIDISFPTYGEYQDIALLISFRMNEERVIRNSFVDGRWGEEETYGGFPLRNDGMFDITVYFFDDYYHIVIGADHFCRFPVRVPLSHTTAVVIVGLSHVEKVSWDQGCKC